MSRRDKRKESSDSEPDSSAPPSDDDTISEISQSSSRYTSATGPSESSHSRRSRRSADSRSRSRRRESRSSGTQSRTDSRTKSSHTRSYDSRSRTSHSRSTHSGEKKKRDSDRRKGKGGRAARRRSSSSSAGSGSDDESPSPSESGSSEEDKRRSKRKPEPKAKAKNSRSKGKGKAASSSEEDSSPEPSDSEPESSDASSDSRSGSAKHSAKGTDRTGSSDDSSDEPSSSSASSSSSSPSSSSSSSSSEDVSVITMPVELASPGPDDISDDTGDSEDDLPPPPPHILAKIVAAKNKPPPMVVDVSMLSAGLNPVQPGGLSGLPSSKTQLRARTNVGQTALEVVSVKGIIPGFQLVIGSGTKIDRCSVVLGGQMANRVVVDQPLKFTHKVGTVVLIFGVLPQDKDIDIALPPPKKASKDKKDKDYKQAKAAQVAGFVDADSGSDADAPAKVKVEVLPAPETPLPVNTVVDEDNVSVLSKLSKISIHSSVAGRSVATGTKLLQLQEMAGGEKKTKTVAEIAVDAMDAGFDRIKARFSGYGDELEDVFYMFVSGQRWLMCRTEIGDDLEFDVGGGSCLVMQDGQDVCSCYMIYHGHEIQFRMPTEKKIQNFLDEFPDVCFMYPDDETVTTAADGDTGDAEAKGEPGKVVPSKDPKVINARFEQKVKDTSKNVNAQAEARKARVLATVNKLKAKQEGKTLDALLYSMEGAASARLSLSMIKNNRNSLTASPEGKSGSMRGSVGLTSRGRGDNLRSPLAVAENKTRVPFADNGEDGDEPLPPPPSAPPRSDDSEADWIAAPVGSPGRPSAPAQPTRRKDLIDSRIRKPVPSVRRVQLLCRWLNFMNVWPNEITVTNMHKEFCTGLLLMELMKVLVPGCESQFQRVNRKTLSRKPAEGNLEQAIGVILRAKVVNHARIPSAKDIFDGNINKIIILLDELFVVYIQAPLYKNSVKMFKWFHKILKQHQRPLPDELFDSGDVGSVWPCFQSGVSIFCVIYHFYGAKMIGKGATSVRVDPIRIVRDPRSYDDAKANMTYVFQLLRALDVQLLWTPEEWLTFPDSEFAILQLSYIYDCLYSMRCTLAPATNDTPGVATGRGGETLIVGLTFADSQAAGIDIHRHTKHVTNLLGAAENMMPMIAVDVGFKNHASSSVASGGSVGDDGSVASSTREDTAFSDMVPMGLLSSNVRIESRRVGVNVPSTSRTVNKSAWVGNMLNVKYSVTDNPVDAPVLHVLRSINQTSTSSHESIAGKKPAFAAATKKPLSKIRKQLLLGKAEQELESRVSRMTIDMDDLKKGIVSLGKDDSDESEAVRAKRQLSTAMKNIEDEMLLTNKELEVLEEELEARYLLLEEEAAGYEEEEYEKTLAYLDEESGRLENDRLRIHELFSMKLSSIKNQFEEAVIRSKAVAEEERSKKKGQRGDSNRSAMQYDDDISVMTGSSSAQGITWGADQVHHMADAGSQRKTPSKGAGGSTPGKAAMTPDAKQQLEKGWTLHSRKNASYNTHIQKAIETSRFKLHQSWTSPRTREKIARAAESEALRIAAKVGLPAVDTADKAALAHMLREKHFVDTADNDSVRSRGSHKPGQNYAMAMNPRSLERSLLDASLIASLANPSTANGGGKTPAEAAQDLFTAFRYKLYSRSSVWYDKKGLQRDVPTEPVTDPPARHVVPLLDALLKTPHPFSVEHTTPSAVPTNVNGELVAAADGVATGPTREQLSLWKRLRKDALEHMEWEEYRQGLAGKYVPPARNNRMSSLFQGGLDAEQSEQKPGGGGGDGDGSVGAVPGGMQESKTSATGDGDSHNDDSESAVANNTAANAAAANVVGSVKGGRRSSFSGGVLKSDKGDAASSALSSEAPATPASSGAAKDVSVDAPASAAAGLPGKAIVASILSTDVDAAVRFLSVGRPFALADRTNKDFLWSVNVVNAKGVSSADRRYVSGSGDSLILEWRPVTDPQGAAIGSVDLSDIKLVQYDAIEVSKAVKSSPGGGNTGLLLTLQLKNSPKALKACGGRTKLLLKGSQVQDVKKYHLCLFSLWQVATQQRVVVTPEEAYDY